MSNPSLDPEELISRLSHRPPRLFSAVITITEPARSPGPALVDRVSSLGVLDRLPPEVASMIFSMLDIRSAVHLAALSFQGHALVQSQRAYRDLMTLAPQALSALARVGLIGLHSVSDLYSALRTQRCKTCTEYGPFLFLLTCQRCCWECLSRNPSLRTLVPSQAKKYIDLSDRDIRQLPTLNVIPGTYDLFTVENRKIISLQTAIDLGLAVRGSAAGPAQVMVSKSKGVGDPADWRLQRASTSNPREDPLFGPDQDRAPTNDSPGMASVPFPSLSKSGKIEHGLWCRGCELTLRQYNLLRLPPRVLTAVVPSDCRPRRVLAGLERRARSEETFLDHIKHCYGAQQLVPELGIVAN